LFSIKEEFMKINAMRLSGFVAAALLLAAAVPVYAHHSFAAIFDATKPVTVKGKFTKMEWVNPHVWFQVEAKDEQGNVQMWRFEVHGTPTMTDAGWKRNSFIGEDVIVDAQQARVPVSNGFHVGSAKRLVIVSNGNKVVLDELRGRSDRPPNQ
jgi:hypothetical protein